MGEFFEQMSRGYTYVMKDLADPRTKDLPLVSSPLLVIVMLALYLEFCTRLGPYWMKDRKAFQLRNVMKLYNIFQVLLSAFLTYQGYQYYSSRNFNILCDKLETSDPVLNKTAILTWWYLFAKVTELLDTILFVLRKKNKQVSTLHLYHHNIALIGAWISVKYFPVGPIILSGTLNSLIHVFMYGYYFVSGLGPKYQKYLWWKQYLTLLQIIQFVIIISHNTIAMFSNCNYPKSFHLFIILNTSLVMYMFSKFYYYNYIMQKPKMTEKVNGETQLNKIYKPNRKYVSVGK